MADSRKNIEIQLSAKDNASSVFSKVGKEFTSLKNVFGGRGEIKEVFEILKGGGAIVGLSLALNSVAQAATAARRAYDDFNEGQKTAADLFDEFVRQIPIAAQTMQILDAAFGRVADAEIKAAQSATLALAQMVGQGGPKLQDQKILSGKSGVDLQTTQAYLGGINVLRQNSDERRGINEQLTSAKGQDADLLRERLRQLDQSDKQAMIEANAKVKEILERSENDFQQRITDVRRKARDAELRSQGKFYQAEEEQIKADREQKLADIDKYEKEQLKSRPDRADDIKAQAGRERELAKADEANRLKDLQKTKEDDTERVRNTRMRERLDLLKLEASLGNERAAKEAKLLEIAMQYDQQIAERQKLLKEGIGLTDGDKTAVQSEIDKLTKLRSKALEGTDTVEKKYEPVQRASIVGTRYVAGYSDNAKDPQSRSLFGIEKNGKEQTVLTREVRDAIKEMANVIRTGGSLVAGAGLG